MKRSMRPSRPGEESGKVATSSRGYIGFAFELAEVPLTAPTMPALIRRDGSSDEHMELQASMPGYRSAETVVTQDRSAWDTAGTP